MGQFQLTANSRILADDQFKNEARLLADRLRTATGYRLRVKSTSSTAASCDVSMTSADAPDSGPEGYELSVQTNGVVIRARTAAGIFYGTQSLLQMLPPEIFSTNRVTDMDWQIPSVRNRGPAALRLARFHARREPPLL